MLEDGKQEIYQRMRGGAKPALWSEVVGYVWVLASLFWSTAAWQYPALLLTGKEDVVLRSSGFIRWVRRQIYELTGGTRLTSLIGCSHL